jgi:hypothetical protein
MEDAKWKVKVLCRHCGPDAVPVSPLVQRDGGPYSGTLLVPGIDVALIAQNTP